MVSWLAAYFMATASLAAHLTDAEIMARYKLEQFDQVAYLLVATVDGRPSCGLSFDEAKGMLLPLHPLVDEKVKADAKGLTEKKLRARARKCETTCHCGIYADLAGQMHDENLKYQLTKKASLDSHARRCLKAAQWFCKSPLLTTLKSRWKTDFPGM